MKNKIRISLLLLCMGSMLVACGKNDGAAEENGPVVLEGSAISLETESITDETATGSVDEAENVESTEEEADKTSGETDESFYIGEYLDMDVSEPNLQIAKGEDGKYIVQIGIFRLTYIGDGVGTLTDEGMTFIGTDSAGNPIGGIIVSDGEKATVTFTDSTWEYLPNGTSFEYAKASNVPNLSEE